MIKYVIKVPVPEPVKIKKKKKMIFKGRRGKGNIGVAIETNTMLAEMICSQWINLHDTEVKARKVPSYIRGVLSVDRKLGNVANVRELVFLLDLAIAIIKYRFEE